MLVLFTDTDTDFTLKEAKEYGYNLISMPYIDNGKEVFPYEDFERFEYRTFYNSLRKGNIPKTSGISPSKYVKYFEPFLANGDDILYVHFSKALSGTFNAMNLAIEELKERYPNRTVYSIDSEGISICSYNILIEISKLVKEGKTIEEIIEWAKVSTQKFAMYFYVNDLKFFKKSGRVSGMSAFFGDLLDIHPIIYMSKEGKLELINKQKGAIPTLKKIVSYMEELGEELDKHKIVIAHADCLHLAVTLKHLIIEKFGDNLDIEIIVVNPTAGAHCGPSSLGVSFYAKHR